MAGASHIGDMSNQPASYVSGTIPSEAIPTTTHLRYDQPGYTTYDASVGVAKDAWMVSFFGQNLSNSDASTFTSSAQFIKSEVPLRPRVLGVKKTRISQAFFEVEQTMLFLFDYGDNWLFRVTLHTIGTKSAKARYPSNLIS